MALPNTGDESDVEVVTTLRVVFPVSSAVVHATFRIIQWHLVALHDGTKVYREFLDSADNATGLLSPPHYIVNSGHIVRGVQENKIVFASSVVS